MSAHIAFGDFTVFREGTWEEELPLRYLSGPDDHVHGRLEIRLDDRAVPAMSHFGERDVCFNEWVPQLDAVLRALGRTARGGYLFDQGEPGQPAFLFEREGDTLYVSAVDSKISGGTGCPDFQRVACAWNDFDQAVERFLVELRVALVSASPAFGAGWWTRNGAKLPRLRA